MNKELFDKLINAQHELEKRAKEILDEINTVREIEGYRYLSITSVSRYEVECDGDEYWRYGGHEHYSFSFPSELLYNERKKNEYIQEIIDEVEEEKRLEMEREEKEKALQKERDLKKYEELKRQFEK